MMEISTINRATKLKCSFSTRGNRHAILWIILIVVTLGLALVVFPYSLNRSVLNKMKDLPRSGAYASRYK
jgi:hypothetical protein